MIMPPADFFPIRRKSKSQLELELLQMRSKTFMAALARFQTKPKRKKK